MRRGFASLCALSFAACAGARTNVVATRALYPVSLSRMIRDSEGNLIPPSRRRVVGAFLVQRTAWSMVWSLANLSRETDISYEVNRQIAEAKGDAIVRLTIVAKHCALDYLAFPMGALPIWPSCTNLDITGDIVKVDAEKAVTR